tara:strand:+ start:118 stop:471 length:354 start_codon:yes stop_codon:yes gene_type:complete
MSTRNMLQQPVVDKSSALDLIFGFLQIAQRRGSFSFSESAKIFECIQQFNDFFQPEEENTEFENENQEESQPEPTDDPPTFPVETLGSFDDNDDDDNDNDDDDDNDDNDDDKELSSN